MNKPRYKYSHRTSLWHRTFASATDEVIDKHGLYPPEGTLHLVRVLMEQDIIDPARYRLYLPPIKENNNENV